MILAVFMQPSGEDLSMRITGWNAAATLALTTMTSVWASAAIAGETWNMPTAYPATNFHTVNAQDFGKCVADGSAGDIAVVVHPNGSLFKGNDIKRAVQTGQTQIGERLLSSHENENAIFGTDSIPFIATSYDESVKLYASARPELEKVLDSQGLKLLYSVPWPPQGMYFKKPVNSGADLAGIRVRSYNISTARVSEFTGMAPVQIEAAEISQALSAGVIESLITSAVTGQDSKAWEQLSHFYKVDAWLPRNHVIVNKAAFDVLSDKTKAAVMDCAAKAEIAGLEKSKTANETALATLIKNGMQVLEPSDALKKDLRLVGAKVVEKWSAKAGNTGQVVMTSFKK
jgi:TRAP-type C4-dicarboxylate transport system substrate-binding protein